MLDLLIDLMTCASALEKANTKDQKLRRVSDFQYSVKVLENRLQKIRVEIEKQAGEPETKL